MFLVTHPREYLPVLDRIEMALDAACGALMTLHSVDLPSAIGDAGRMEAHVAQAISGLQHAIDQLRDAHMQGQTGLALGFVLARNSSNSCGHEGFGQSSPRRTA